MDESHPFILAYKDLGGCACWCRWWCVRACLLVSVVDACGRVYRCAILIANVALESIQPHTCMIPHLQQVVTNPHSSCYLIHFCPTCRARRCVEVAGAVTWREEGRGGGEAEEQEGAWTSIPLKNDERMEHCGSIGCDSTVIFVNCMGCRRVQITSAFRACE